MNVYSNPSLSLQIKEKVRILPNEKQNKVCQGDILFTGSSETPDECGMSSVVIGNIAGDYYLNSFSFGFRLNEQDLFDFRYLKHLFRGSFMRIQIGKTASGVTRYNVSKQRFGQIVVPVPSISIQSSIADVLDKFESLTYDLTSGLPAEIKARQQQYEYYRDRLLSFPLKSDN